MSQTTISDIVVNSENSEIVEDLEDVRQQEFLNDQFVDSINFGLAR